MGRRIESTTYDDESGRAILAQRNVITKIHYRTVKCKFCGDWESVVQYGRTPKGSQRYLCQKCNRTFMDNKAPERMRYPTEVIASAINQFYEGASLHKIRRQLQLDYGVMPDHHSIYSWITRYTKKAVKDFGPIKARVGNTWVADETVLKLKSGGGENIWLFDCLDEDSRFLLATHLTHHRYTRDAQTLMQKARSRAKRTPDTIITDKLRSYLDAVEQTFGADTKHRQSGPFAIQHSTRSIERLHGTLKDRTKIMRGLANRETAKLIMDGWGVHYNFFRPHQGLKGKTPSQAADVDAPYRSWADVVKGD